MCDMHICTGCDAAFISVHFFFYLSKKQKKINFYVVCAVNSYAV